MDKNSKKKFQLPEEKELRVYHLPTETRNQSQTYSFAIEVPSMSDLPEYHQMKDRMAREVKIKDVSKTFDASLEFETLLVLNNLIGFK